MTTEADLRAEIRRIRERPKELSGFWISELAAATYALAWMLEKRPAPPSADIGSSPGRSRETLGVAREGRRTRKRRKEAQNDRSPARAESSELLKRANSVNPFAAPR